MSIYTPPESMWVVLGAALLLSITASAVNRIVLPVAKIRRYSREIRKHREAMAKAKEENNQKLILKLERKKKFIEKIQREQASTRFKPTLIYMIPFMALFYYLYGLYGFPGMERMLPSVVTVLPINLGSIPGIPEGMLGAMVGPQYLDLNWLIWWLGGVANWPGIYLFAMPSDIHLLLRFSLNMNIPIATDAFSSIPGFGVYFLWWYFISNFAFAGIFQRLFGVNFET
ncbi:MAG: EMC3/TMCO1 family protein [Candidatus Lokiarchaeia archaeon]